MTIRTTKTIWLSLFVLACGLLPQALAAPPPDHRLEILAAMKQATAYYRERAFRGGYVYYYVDAPDFKRRLGEGAASETQIWVQPPGTPAVGRAYLVAYAATKDPYFLDAATETAAALLAGQLQSGGWSNQIDFNPQSKQAGLYRSGQGNPKGRNYSTLDDNATQAALSFLMRCDQAHDFKHKDIHQGVEFALKALLAAQFPNGAFPQVWSGPVEDHPIISANYPDYDWRTENRFKEYWNLYTLNDGLAGDVSRVLIEAYQIYGDEHYLAALKQLGKFLIAAQMTEPQPAWAQQYHYSMQPAWARKFEPPAIAGRESEDAIETLLTIYRVTDDEKFLAPIPTALAYLKKSELADGQLARYYELQTNRPLYMTKDYHLTNDDSSVPDHYGWKTTSHVDSLTKKYDALQQRGASSFPVNVKSILSEVRPCTAKEALTIAGQLDDQGRWVSKYAGERLVGQPKVAPGTLYISSAVFCENLQALSSAYTSLLFK